MTDLTQLKRVLDDDMTLDNESEYEAVRSAVKELEDTRVNLDTAVETLELIQASASASGGGWAAAIATGFLESLKATAS